MKIRVLLFALALLQTKLILAQTKKIQIGLEGGPTLCSIDGKDRFKNDHSTKVGYTGALSLQYNFSRFLSLRTGIGFERKGYVARVYNPMSSRDAEKVRINFDYLTVPLLARVSVGKKVTFFANAGPYFAYLLKISDSKKMYKSPLFVWKPYYKRFDWGITTGIGGAVPVKEHLLLTLEVRYNLGLLNLMKEHDYILFKFYNNSASLLAGVAYKF